MRTAHDHAPLQTLQPTLVGRGAADARNRTAPGRRYSGVPVTSGPPAIDDWSLPAEPSSCSRWLPACGGKIVHSYLLCATAPWLDYVLSILIRRAHTAAQHFVYAAAERYRPLPPVLTLLFSSPASLPNTYSLLRANTFCNHHLPHRDMVVPMVNKPPGSAWACTDATDARRVPRLLIIATATLFGTFATRCAAPRSCYLYWLTNVSLPDVYTIVP